MNYQAMTLDAYFNCSQRWHTMINREVYSNNDVAIRVRGQRIDRLKIDPKDAHWVTELPPRTKQQAAKR